MKETVIKVNGLTKKFADFIATNAISFEVEKGEIFGFLGPMVQVKQQLCGCFCGY